MHYTLEIGEFTLDVMLGNYLYGRSLEEMLNLWYIASHYIYQMYIDTLRSRQGIG